MKHILLYLFFCISTCTLAQGVSQSFVAADSYGIASSYADNNPNIKIFPNPTADFITVEDVDGVVAKVSIFNLLGKEVQSHSISRTQTFDLLNFQKGIYLVQLKDEKGHVIQTVRIKKI